MKRLERSAVLLYIDREAKLKEADDLYWQGPESEEQTDVIYWSLSSWSVLVGSERSREVMRSMSLSLASMLASRIRCLRQWWLYPLLFLLDAYFLVDLLITKKEIRFNDLMLSAVKYRTGFHMLAWLAPAKNLIEQDDVNKYFAVRSCL